MLDVGELSDVTDYIVICSLDSDRGVKTVAEEIEKRLKETGNPPLGVEGREDARWVLIDAVDVVANVFYEPVREFFDLEGLWIDAPRVELGFDEGTPGGPAELVGETA